MKTIIVVQQSTGSRTTMFPVESLQSFVQAAREGCDPIRQWDDIASDFVVVVTEDVEGDTYRSLLPVMSMQSLHDLFSGGATEPSRVDRSNV